MKILHVSDSYLPTLGGIELHLRDLAARQRADGHDVVVVTRTPAAGADSDPDVRRVLGPDRASLTDERPDVVHAHVSIISPFALGAARRAALAGVPTVVTVHSLWTHVGPLPELARELWGMRRWDVTWTAVSERAARPVRDLLGVPVRVLPNAVDLTEWASSRRLPSADPPRVLSVMRLTSVKRALPLVRVLRRAAAEADFTATIVGDGPERAPVQRYLRRHGLSGRVRLTGALDRREIRALLDEASVFLAPAHRESFGLAPLEARAVGVPVVASSQSGVPTFIEHGTEGLLGRDDTELGDHLVRFLRDDELRERVAWHNRSVPPAFGWAQALDRHASVYAAAATARSQQGAARRRSGRVLVG